MREAVGGWLADRKAEIKSKEDSKDWWQQYASSLKSIKVLDPACGSGAFLVKVFDYLQNEWQEVQKHIKTDWTYKDILTHNIYGVDINPASTGITKLSLWLKTAHYREPLTTLDGNIKIGNSLIDNPDIAGYYSEFEGKVIQEVVTRDLLTHQELDKLTAEGVKKSLAFKWSEEFKEVFATGGFDIVIGNPPYVSMENIDTEHKKFYGAKFNMLERKYDLSVCFIINAFKIINKNGYIGYIIPITWQTGENYAKLREWLFNSYSVNKVLNLPFGVFDDAYVETGIALLQSAKRESNVLCYNFDKKVKIENLQNIDYEIIEKPTSHSSYKIYNNSLSCGISKLKNIVKLGDITKSTQGLSPSFFEYTEKGGYDLFTDGEIARYHINIRETKKISLQSRQTLQQFYDTSDKILIRRIINRQDRLVVSFYTEQMVFTKDVTPFIITNNAFNPLYLLSILASKFVSRLYINSSAISLKNDFRQTTLAELRNLPIPQIPHTEQTPFITHAQRMLDLTKQFNELSNKFTKLLSADLGVVKITKKLEKWYNLQVDELFLEVGKQNKSLSLSQKSQWLDHFEAEKQKSLALWS